RNTSPIKTYFAKIRIHFLLSHEPQTRRRRQLVHLRKERPRQTLIRTQSHRPQIRRQSQTNHHRIHRLRRLGDGRHPIRPRRPRTKENRLRNAVRHSHITLRRLWEVLHRTPSSQQQTKTITSYIKEAEALGRSLRFLCAFFLIYGPLSCSMGLRFFLCALIPFYVPSFCSMCHRINLWTVNLFYVLPPRSMDYHPHLCAFPLFYRPSSIPHTIPQTF